MDTNDTPNISTCDEKRHRKHDQTCIRLRIPRRNTRHFRCENTLCREGHHRRHIDGRSRLHPRNGQFVRHVFRYDEGITAHREVRRDRSTHIWNKWAY